jgi:hypothetical protein
LIPTLARPRHAWIWRTSSASSVPRMPPNTARQ